ncbi:hypothetical protein HAX54_016937, partial [Datura stramonium]|nr:hypothetical protein [Datura stramonium]
PLGPFERIPAYMAAMKKLLRGFPRPAPYGASSSFVVGGTEAFQHALGSLAQDHVELWADLEDVEGDEEAP